MAFALQRCKIHQTSVHWFGAPLFWFVTNFHKAWELKWKTKKSVIIFCVFTLFILKVVPTFVPFGTICLSSALKVSSSWGSRQVSQPNKLGCYRDDFAKASTQKMALLQMRPGHLPSHATSYARIAWQFASNFSMCMRLLGTGNLTICTERGQVCHQYVALY